MASRCSGGNGRSSVAVQRFPDGLIFSTVMLFSTRTTLQSSLRKPGHLLNEMLRDLTLAACNLSGLREKSTFSSNRS
jgi:hypothetical protein